MHLRFSPSELGRWARRFSYYRKEQQLLRWRGSVQSAGHLKKSQLRSLAEWKAPRSAGNVEDNAPSFVHEVTRFALSTDNERARIEALTLLSGVQWPTASVVLHFFHTDKYPILDFRALWSLGIEQPSQYTFDFWKHYVSVCRHLSRRHSVSMRELDKALWQFSKENQPRGSA